MANGRAPTADVSSRLHARMQIVPQLIGYPRIGPNRELKWALERTWAGRSDRADLDARVAELRADHLAEQRELTGSAVTTSSCTTRRWRPGSCWASPRRSSPAGHRPVRRAHRPRPRQHRARGVGDDEVVRHELPHGRSRGRAAGRRAAALPWREPTGDGAIWPILGPYSLARLAKVAPGSTAPSCRPRPRRPPGAGSARRPHAIPDSVSSSTSRAWAWS